MVGGHPLAQVCRAHAVALLAKGVVEVELVDAKLVGHRDVGLVGHATGDPVVSAHGLHPPDLIGVREGRAVHLVRAIALEKLAEASHALASRVDVGQDDGEEVLLAYAASDLELVVILALDAAGGDALDERVCAEHALVGGERLGGGRRILALVEAGLAPDALGEVGVGNGRVALRVVGQVDLYVRDDRAVVARLVLGRHDDEALALEAAVSRVLVARHDRGAVVAGLLANENGGAGHVFLLAVVSAMKGSTKGDGFAWSRPWPPWGRGTK